MVSSCSDLVDVFVPCEVFSNYELLDRDDCRFHVDLPDLCVSM